MKKTKDPSCLCLHSLFYVYCSFAVLYAAACSSTLVVAVAAVAAAAAAAVSAGVVPSAVVVAVAVTLFFPRVWQVEP